MKSLIDIKKDTKIKKLIFAIYRVKTIIVIYFQSITILTANNCST